VNIDIEAIRARLPEQRWFGGKTRPIEAVEIFDRGVIEDGPPTLVLTLLRVRFADGGDDLFHLPLLVEEDGSSRDAFEDASVLRVFGELMAQGSTIKGDHGIFEFNGPGLNPSAPPGHGSARVMSAEQSNTSFVLDEQTIVKMYRRLAVGTNPDLELARVLTTASFDHIPTHVGEITYEFEEDDEPLSMDLGLAQAFLPDGKEGWTHAIERLHELYDAADPADVREDFAFLTEERGGDFLAEIEELGDATGALHVALSREENEPASTPEAIDEWDLKEWAKSARGSLDRLLDEGVGELRPYAMAIRSRIARIEEVEDRGFKTRIHGDYHLGQVLLTSRGWMILDFEGEPARTLEERRAKHTPLRDVAGMLRSFSYAAVAALFQRADPDTPAWTSLSPWATTWERLARERFLAGYLTKSHEGDFLPSDREDINLMLDVLEIDKALYELGYERGHRPEWVRIPLRGIAQIAERGDGE